MTETELPADHWATIFSLESGRRLVAGPDQIEGTGRARSLSGVLVNTVEQRSAGIADTYRNRLAELYDEGRAADIEFAEAFELCQYGRQVSEEGLRGLFLIE